MDDEDIFRRAMASLGVRPLDGRKRRGDRPAGDRPAEPADKVRKAPRGKSPRRDSPECLAPDEEDALFLATMKALEPPPDKDVAAVPERRPTRRLRASVSRDARPEATLDLHGSSSEQALDALERFVASSAAERMWVVRVVTGKGLRSAGGVAVLKEAVERWLRSGGKKWVGAYSEAPRALGGRGAYILYLRRR